MVRTGQLAYTRAQNEPRFHTKMVGRDIVVIPSGELADEVDQILEDIKAGDIQAAFTTVTY